MWAGIQAVREDGSHDGLLHRLGHVVHALTYGGLAFLAGKQVLSGGGGGGSSSQASATLMSNPVGRIGIGVAGVVLLGVAAYQAWQAWTGDLREDLDDGGQAPSWATTVGRIGYAGRALSFALIGGFVVHGAVTFDPSEATGLDRALDELSRTAPGRVGVAVVAAGMAVLAGWFVLVARHGVRGDVDADDIAAEQQGS